MAELELLVERLKAENRVISDQNRALKEKCDFKEETNGTARVVTRQSKRRRKP